MDVRTIWEFQRNIKPCSHIKIYRKALDYHHHAFIGCADQHGCDIFHYKCNLEEYFKGNTPGKITCDRLNFHSYDFNQEVKSIFDFEKGDVVIIVARNDYPKTTEEIQRTIKRAESRLGEAKYSISSNNCECYVNWIFTGDNTSQEFQDCDLPKSMLVGAVDAVLSDGILRPVRHGTSSAVSEVLNTGSLSLPKPNNLSDSLTTSDALDNPANDSEKYSASKSDSNEETKSVDKTVTESMWNVVKYVANVYRISGPGTGIPRGLCLPESSFYIPEMTCKIDQCRLSSLFPLTQSDMNEAAEYVRRVTSKPFLTETTKDVYFSNMSNAARKTTENAGKLSSGITKGAVGTAFVWEGMNLSKKLYDIMNDEDMDDKKKQKCATSEISSAVVGAPAKLYGSVVGQALIPVPLLGSAVGGAIGGAIGNAVGGAIAEAYFSIFK